MGTVERVDVQYVFSLITRFLGDEFSLNEILSFVGQCRGKRVILQEQSLPVGSTGYCFAFQDVDLIVVRQGLDQPRYLVACLHECAHFLLRHIPRTSAGPTTATFTDFLNSGGVCRGVYRSQTTAYDEQQERDAEILATLLIACIEEDEAGPQGMPPTVQEMWG
jgi:hypothetical protein